MNPNQTPIYCDTEEKLLVVESAARLTGHTWFPVLSSQSWTVSVSSSSEHTKLVSSYNLKIAIPTLNQISQAVIQAVTSSSAIFENNKPCHLASVYADPRVRALSSNPPDFRNWIAVYSLFCETSKYAKINFEGSGVSAQLLKPLTAFSEDQDATPSTLWWLTTVWNSRPKGSRAFSDLLRHQTWAWVPRHTVHTKHSHTWNDQINLKIKHYKH